VKPSTADLIKGIRHDLIEARNCFSVYRAYKLKETREKYSDAFRTFKPFLSCDLRAHFAAMMVTLGRIFDREPKYIGIAALLKAAPHLKDLEPEKYKLAMDLWASEKIMLLRHQVVAHRSPRTEKIFQLVDTCLADFSKLIQLLEQLVEAWSRAAKCDMRNLGPKMDREVDDLLKALNRVSKD